VRMAGQVKIDVASMLTTPEYKRMDRCGHLALIAAREAWEQAGRPDADPERLAVVIGSGYGGLDTTLEQTRTLDSSGPRRVSPHTLTRIMTNAPAAWVSIDVGAKGGARTPVSACASGAEAIAQAADMIRAGAADVVIAGGVDACINGLIISGFAQIRALSTRNGDPQSASRPFDRDRDGFVMAEGAAILVLEREDHARARGAEILGVVAGTAVTSDAVDIVAADPAMQRRVMEKAITAAGLGAGDIGLVHAHATSTPVGDRLEAGAIRAVLGNQVPVTSTKSLTGHLLGGAGALGAIVMIQALKTGEFPGTGNLDQPDDGIDLHLLRETVAGQPARAGIANAFGFGGHSTALVITES
ncbi:MAG TPA: beta-ketoacyl-[acyl-carrier-protein] synthase family protein, partial [Arthrobacter sp.]|nr:beta-ketoacyl-[acyl-carrier-protein] synthase family protein [Arthrobacter sp.]